MDFKGITWAGNIYQKFEAMCMEVEEVMYQDTVKYMENQVQKVGVSVKKFYSEVMQDVLPSSCVDPVKVAAGDLSLNPYAHIDFNKKPKSFLLDCSREQKKMKTGDDATIPELISEKLSSLSDLNNAHHLHPSSGVSVQNASSELSSAKDKKLGVTKRPIGIRRISRVDRPSKITSPSTSLPLLGSNKIASGDTRESSAVASGDINSTSPSNFIERCDPGDPIESTPISSGDINSVSPSNFVVRRDPCDPIESTPISGTPINCPVSDKIIPHESVSQTSNDPEHLSFTDPNLSTDACNIESVGNKVQMPYEGKILEDKSTLNTSCDTCHVESEVEHTVISDEDISDMVFIAEREEADARIEIPNTFERSNLEETCVLVEGDRLDFKAQGEKKQKSYKKKISSALSAKLRRSKNQVHTGIGGTSSREAAVPVPPLESNVKILAAHDSLESEWELL